MKSTIQKAREWIILLVGLALMIFCVYAFYADLKGWWENEIDLKILAGGFILGVLLLSQPKRLNEIFSIIFTKIKSYEITKKSSKGKS